MNLRIPMILPAAVLALALGGCGNSEVPAKSDAPAQAAAPSVAAASDSSSPAAEPSGDLCQAAMALNDVQVDESASAATLDEYADTAQRIVDASPAEIHDEAERYFGEIVDIVRSGNPADLEELSAEGQDAFNAVATYLLQHCDSGQ